LAVAIRLTRVGATKRPAYRVIAIDKRRSRDGRALEILGYYDPLTEPATVRLETDKIKAWIGKGAQPSDMVVRLMRQAEATEKAGADAPTPKRATKRTSAKPSRKAAAKAQAAPAPDVVPAAPEAPEETAAPGTPEETAAEAAAPTDAVPAAEEAPVAEAAPVAEDATAEAATAEAAADEPPAAEEPPADGGPSAGDDTEKATEA
jgi:small subunit ribosomal protein S16